MPVSSDPGQPQWAELLGRHGEDANRYRKRNGVQVLAGLRNVADLARLMRCHGQEGPQPISA